MADHDERLSREEPAIPSARPQIVGIRNALRAAVSALEHIEAMTSRLETLAAARLAENPAGVDPDDGPVPVLRFPDAQQRAESAAKLVDGAPPLEAGTMTGRIKSAGTSGEKRYPISDVRHTNVRSFGGQDHATMQLLAAQIRDIAQIIAKEASVQPQATQAQRIVEKAQLLKHMIDFNSWSG